MEPAFADTIDESESELLAGSLVAADDQNDVACERRLPNVARWCSGPLPLLQASVVPSGLVSNDVFLAGYGAAQAVPGPLFTFAAYLGAVMPSPFGGWMGGLALLSAIFIPAFLLVVGALPYWETMRQRDGVQSWWSRSLRSPD